MSTSGIASACLICGQRVSRFWGIGATYSPHGSSPDDVHADISVAGFCRAHRDEIVPFARKLIEDKGTVLSLSRPSNFARARSSGSSPSHPLRSLRLSTSSAGRGVSRGWIAEAPASAERWLEGRFAARPARTESDLWHVRVSDCAGLSRLQTRSQPRERHRMS